MTCHCLLYIPSAPMLHQSFFSVEIFLSKVLQNPYHYYLIEVVISQLNI